MCGQNSKFILGHPSALAAIAPLPLPDVRQRYLPTQHMFLNTSIIKVIGFSHRQTSIMPLLSSPLLRVGPLKKFFTLESKQCNQPHLEKTFALGCKTNLG
jgi:hypothetical protein